MDTEKPLKSTLDDFFAGYTKLRYKRGEVIVRAEDPPPGIFYLTQGFVRMINVTETGEMLVMHVFKPGSFFPMTWALNETPNRYTFEAMTQVELYRAPRAEVMQMMKIHPEILYDLTSRLLSGASGLLRRMEDLVLEPAYVKTVKLLLYYCENFAERDPQGQGLVLHLTHREIAAWIGSTRETASLQVEDLLRKQLISYRGRLLIVPDVKRLTAEVGK